MEYTLIKNQENKSQRSLGKLQLKQVMTQTTIKSEDIEWGEPILLKTIETLQLQDRIQQTIQEQLIHNITQPQGDYGLQLYGSGNTSPSLEQANEQFSLFIKQYKMGRDYRPVHSEGVKP